MRVEGRADDMGGLHLGHRLVCCGRIVVYVPLDERERLQLHCYDQLNRTKSRQD